MAKRNPKDKPAPLTVPEILAWADAHHARRGAYPKYVDGSVIDGLLGLNWRKIDNALRIGLRGRPGGSSLARLLAARRAGTSRHSPAYRNTSSRRERGHTTSSAGQRPLSSRRRTFKNRPMAMACGDRTSTHRFSSTRPTS